MTSSRCEFLGREFDCVLFTHVPHGIAFLAEVFESDPYGVVHVFDEVGAPIVEYLETSDLIAGVLHVDPTVGYYLRGTQRGDVSGVLEFQVFDQESDGDEVAVRKSVRDFDHRFGCLVDAVYEVFDGHG